jgi:hypothetical protein
MRCYQVWYCSDPFRITKENKEKLLYECRSQREAQRAAARALGCATLRSLKGYYSERTLSNGRTCYIVGYHAPSSTKYGPSVEIRCFYGTVCAKAQDFSPGSRHL